MRIFEGENMNKFNESSESSNIFGVIDNIIDGAKRYQNLSQDEKNQLKEMIQAQKKIEEQKTQR